MHVHTLCAHTRPDECVMPTVFCEHVFAMCMSMCLTCKWQAKFHLAETFLQGLSHKTVTDLGKRHPGLAKVQTFKLAPLLTISMISHHKMQSRTTSTQQLMSSLALHFSLHKSTHLFSFIRPINSTSPLQTAIMMTAHVPGQTQW